LTLKEIPIELSRLPNLLYLDLSTNLLKDLPKDFGGNCQNLQNLNLGYNEIAHFPEEILKISNLNYIDLRGNSIDFTGCKELEDFKGTKRTDTPKPNLITNGLYLGDITTTQSTTGLSTAGITHVLSICHETVVQFKDIIYKQIRVADNSTENLKSYFPETNQFIDQAIASGGVVYVHCNRGISRSATVVIAYIMWKNKLGVEGALNLVRKKREVIYPNGGFMKQLEEYRVELLVEKN